MKKVSIATINDNNNIGNRLQNYAVQQKLKELGYEVVTIKNDSIINSRDGIWKFFKRIIRIILDKMQEYKNKRLKYFKKFNKNIKFSKMLFMKWNYWLFTNSNYYITGSDQVWNPNFSRLTNFELLSFVPGEKRIAFSASFGISELPEQYHEKTARELKKFKAISVREDAGKKIVEELTGRNDVEVLVDPTMLITVDEWNKVAKKPKQMKSNNKYILNYFLGELSESRKKEIERIAKENDCDIINILDEDDIFYETGPSEFIYLEKNAFLVCTDSFHACIFAVIYNRPFIVFEREENLANMNSRIETLLNKFKLENRRYRGKIANDLLEVDYSEAYRILEKEKEKADKFLKNALKY